MYFYNDAELARGIEVEVQKELEARFTGLPSNAYTYAQMKHHAEQVVEHYRQLEHFTGSINISFILYRLTGR